MRSFRGSMSYPDAKRYIQCQYFITLLRGVEIGLLIGPPTRLPWEPGACARPSQAQHAPGQQQHASSGTHAVKRRELCSTHACAAPSRILKSMASLTPSAQVHAYMWAAGGGTWQVGSPEQRSEAHCARRRTAAAAAGAGAPRVARA